MRSESYYNETKLVNEKRTHDHFFKLLLIGDSGVGKTCVLYRFSDEAFYSDFMPTIGIDFKIKTVELYGKRIRLQLWDTSGQEKFRTITHSYYRGALGIFVVYDITCRRSFENLDFWIANIKEHGSDTAVMCIVGNKCDADTRQVTMDEGLKYAQRHNCNFFETSALTDINIDQAFQYMTEAVLQTASKVSRTRPASGIIQLSGSKQKQDCCTG